MTMLHALVIDDDRTMLGFVAEALATFKPGFRVSTATSLDGATRRIAVQRPDIVLIRSSAVSSGEWGSWVRTHHIEPERIGILGHPATSHVGCATIDEPVSLPTLLEVARGLVSGACEYDRQSDDEVPELHAVQG